MFMPRGWHDVPVIGVTGATGEIGGRVARRLAGRGLPQRLVVRDAARAPSLEGAEVAVAGGYDDSARLRGAFDGVSTLLLVSAHEDPDRVGLHRTAIDAAAAAGVERIVYTSFVGAAPAATFTFARDHFHTEQHIRGSQLDFTFSRQSMYLDFIPGMADEQGVIRGPAGDGRVAPVLRDDVADALVEMLTGAGHRGATYELTGPEALTVAEIAAVLSRSSGRRVSYEQETLDQARASRASFGAPEWELEGWVTSYAAIAAGELALVTEDVRRLTGHEATSVAAYVEHHFGSSGGEQTP
jgi:NAD(P)H dehydrogenase (quinone)